MRRIISLTCRFLKNLPVNLFMYEDSGLLCCNAVSLLQTAEKHQTRDTKSHPRIPGPSITPLWGPQILVACGCICIYRVSWEECKKLQESVPYVKIYRYNPKHVYPKLNGYGDNGQRSLKL
jgi:hypothetical protein